ncbi:MAG TPA: sodium/solute symporter [Candidatus Hydrogenedentes bacterium]|nr:sodium/solute symporter [Candidatus Hydrogenedentota bacterium]HQE81949.1 sodium/solute symporter [Candidatus Hydrogenedentota bacterium]HQH53795.1 sodium/solute symporter [Candidatus Hydrogenedentota bacterium]HQM49077.1 sodium/solute symporter [Candidatus Hydrogenedentota bacterium]
MTFTLSALDIAVILVSLFLVLAVGLWASRKQGRTARDYFLASGKLPWWIIGAAFVSTSVSSEQIVGTIGQAYKHGMGIANWEWWLLPVYSVLIIVFIPIYLRNRISTVPELLSRRFSSVCGDIYSYIMLFAYIFVFLVPVLYGGSLTFASLTGWNFYYILWAMIILVAAYTVKGGLMSVVWTDALQCLMLVGGGLLLFFVSLHQVPGGWHAMVEANPERFHLYCPPDHEVSPFLGVLAGTIGLFVFYSAANQVMVQRVLGARSRWDGIMGIVFAGFINFLRPLVTCFLGFIVYHWIHEMHQAEPLDSVDQAFAFSLRYLAPEWGLRGIVLAGFIAAVMSTVSALANSTATIFSLDVYKKLLRPGAPERDVVTVGRMASLSALVIAGILAPQVERFGGIFLYFQQGITFIATPIITVILAGLFSRRVNATGALAGLIAGIISTAVLLGLLIAGIHMPFHWLYVGFFQQLLVLAVVIAGSLATSAPPSENTEPFLWRPSLLTEHVRLEPARPWYASAALWYALFAAIWFYLYWRFW